MNFKNDLMYKVTREGGTEPPFSGEYNENKKKENIYVFTVKQYYFHLKKNLTLEQVGQHFMM